MIWAASRRVEVAHDIAVAARRGPAEWREAIREVLEEVNRLDADRIKQVRDELLRYRAEVRRALSERSATDFTLTHRRALIEEMDALAAQLDARLRGTLDTAVGDAGALGRQAIERPLTAMGGDAGRVANMVPAVDFRALAVASETAGDLITDVTNDLRASVRAEISRAIVGGKTPFEAMEAITGALDKDGDPLASPFASNFYRAEAIVRTELNGAFNRSHNDAVRETSLRVPGLLKKTWLWSASLNPRAGHQALNGVTIDAHEKFELRGRDGLTYEIDGPHDPILPAGEIINCHCTTAASFAA